MIRLLIFSVACGSLFGCSAVKNAFTLHEHPRRDLPPFALAMPPAPQQHTTPTSGSKIILASQTASDSDPAVTTAELTTDPTPAARQSRPDPRPGEVRRSPLNLRSVADRLSRSKLNRVGYRRGSPTKQMSAAPLVPVQPDDDNPPRGSVQQSAQRESLAAPSEEAAPSEDSAASESPGLTVPPGPRAADGSEASASDVSVPAELKLDHPDPLAADGVSLDLATALGMVGGQHPAIGFARWRVQEAYAQHAQAEVLWLPSLRAGFSFHRHDGNLQASDGSIIDVNRSSFQYGLGAGGVGAGTTQRAGLIAEFHTTDAVFQPRITQKRSWAAGHAANAVNNRQLLDVAVAYVALVAAQQDLRVIEDSRQQTAELARITTDFAQAGQGPQADADRMATELKLIDARRIAGRERVEVASAALVQAMSLQGSRTVVTRDPALVPIDLVATEMDRGSMIATGLSTRPELKEAQALVAVACEQYRRQRYAPFVPSVLLGVSPTGFGGGLGNNVQDVNGRVDFDAVVTWELRNFGFGERAARNESNARIEQAKFERVRMMDQVAREVSESYAQVRRRGERMEVAQEAIQTAQDSYERNMSRIRDGQGLPIEVLQSVQALETARRGYLEAVASYNQAQFRLQWALGWPVQAIPPAP